MIPKEPARSTGSFSAGISPVLRPPCLLHGVEPRTASRLLDGIDSVIETGGLHVGFRSVGAFVDGDPGALVGGFIDQRQFGQHQGAECGRHPHHRPADAAGGQRADHGRAPLPRRTSRRCPGSPWRSSVFSSLSCCCTPVFPSFRCIWSRRSIDETRERRSSL